MAVNNEDRVSSRRLLDTLKGLQASRHLGSEPEVETETVEYPAKVRPVAGTYPNTEQGLLDILSDSAIDVEHNLPIKVYGAIARDANGFTVPEKSGEPLAILDVVSKVDGFTAISDIELTPEMLNNQPITGHYFMINYGVGYGCFYEKSDLTNAITLHVWETTASTEEIVTKTKHTIKQDYLPNADWSVNDPDADGYVEGRTHWVEAGETEATINVLSSAQVGNFAEGTSNKFGAIKKFTYPTGEYNPGRTGEIISITNGGQTMQFAYIGEDANGNAIVPTNPAELRNALSTTAIGIMLLEEQGAGTMVYVAYPNVTSDDACTVTIVSETVHKLDSKFINEPENPINSLDYLEDNRTNFKGKNIGMHKFNTNIDYLANFDIRKTSNSGGYWLVEASYPRVQTKTVGNNIDYMPSYLFDPKISSAVLILGVIACLPDIELASITNPQESPVTLSNKTVDMGSVTFSNDDNSVSVTFREFYILGPYNSTVGATCVGLPSEHYAIMCQHRLFLTTPTLYMNGSSSFHKTMENILCWQDNTDTLIIRAENWLHNQLSRNELYLNDYECEMCDGVLLGKVNIQGLTPTNGVIKKEIDYYNSGDPTYFVTNVVHGAQGGFALMPEVNAIVIFKLEPKKMTMYVKAKDFSKLGDDVVFKGEIMPRGFYNVTDESVQETTNPFE